MNLIFYLLHPRRNISRWNKTSFTKKTLERPENTDVLNKDDFQEIKSSISQTERAQCVRICMNNIWAEEEKKSTGVSSGSWKMCLSLDFSLNEVELFNFPGELHQRTSLQLFFPSAQPRGPGLATDCHTAMEPEWGHRWVAVRGSYLSRALPTSEKRRTKVFLCVELR